MIICIVIDSYNDRSNGTSMSAFRFVRELVARGNEVRVITANTKSISINKQPYILGSVGEKIYYVKERYIPLVTEISHKQQMFFAKADKHILAQALNGCDVAHFYLPFRLEIVGVHLCRKLKIPYIGAFHLQPQHISFNMNMNIDLFNNYLFRRFWKHFYRYIHHVHCPSKLMCDEIQKASYGGKKYIISNGFMLPKKHLIGQESKMQHPKDENFNDGLFHIFCVGRFSREKRQEILIKAIAKSPYKSFIKLHCHGVGPRDGYLRHLCKVSLQNVAFGFMDNALLLQELTKAHLYVHPAEVESEAISCLEAISLGVVPLIADSKISAANQFALSKKSLFKTNDVDDLCSKIGYWFRQFKNHKSKIQDIKQQYATSSKDYALQISIDKILALYNEAIADFRANPALFETTATKS